MKLIRRIFWGIAGCIALLFLVAAFLPATCQVTRTATFHAPVDRVFQVLVDLERRAEWDPWLKTARVHVGGSGQGVGAFYQWEGESMGRGSHVIESVIGNARIESRLIFESPHYGEASEVWILKSRGETTEVFRVFENALKYPVERYLGLMMDHFIGPDLEKGLKHLKALVET